MTKKKNISYTKQFFFRYLPLIVWVSFIWLLSSQEGIISNTQPTIQFYIERKGAHLLEYAILFFLVFRVISLWTKREKDTVIWSFIWVLWLATLDESHQSMVFGRDGRVLDVCIDMLGACIAFFLITGAKKIKNI